MFLYLFCGQGMVFWMGCLIWCHQPELDTSGYIVTQKTLIPIEYYLKLPDQLEERLSIVVDPMLATGNSAAAAVQRIKDAGAKRIKFVCLLAAPEGLEAFSKRHPDVPIITAAVDRELKRSRLYFARPW